ncbi:MAG: UDP-glucose dehydrogenase family protein, partial [Chloroflexota bacterium]
VKSTVIPGTADGVVRPAIEAESGRKVGEFGLCVNPEFLREGHAIADFLDPDRLIIGQWDPRSGETLARLYQSFSCPMIHTTLQNAELIKYASNALLATLISFSNEIATLCEATPGADIQNVIRGVHLDRRLSPVVDGQRIEPGVLSYLWAGCGFGGSCFPKDVNALRAYGRRQSVDVPLLDAVMAVNDQRPLTLVDLTEKAVGSRAGTTVAVLGLAFKPGSDDTRKSPAFPVVRELRRRGATVQVIDPLLTSKPLSPALGEALGPGVAPCATGAEALRGADAAVLVTGWPEFAAWDWEELGRLMRQAIVVDGRNALADVRWPAPVRYVPIGRVPEAAAALVEVG